MPCVQHDGAWESLGSHSFIWHISYELRLFSLWTWLMTVKSKKQVNQRVSFYHMLDVWDPIGIMYMLGC